MNRLLILFLTIALIALSGVIANAQSKSNLPSGQALATVERNGKQINVVFDEKALNDDYKSYVSAETKKDSRNVASLNDYRQSLEKEIVTRTRPVLVNGQPQTAKIRIYWYRDEKGKLHMVIDIS